MMSKDIKTQEEKDEALRGGWLGSLFKNPNREKAAKKNSGKKKKKKTSSLSEKMRIRKKD